MNLREHKNSMVVLSSKKPTQVLIINDDCRLRGFYANFTLVVIFPFFLYTTTSGKCMYTTVIKKIISNVINY